MYVLLQFARRGGIVPVAVFMAAALVSGPARAIDGAPVDKQNHFANAGAIVIVSPLVNVPGFDNIPAPWVGGSGTLIHPRVMLVAGHSVAAIESAIAAGNSLNDVRVSFSPNAYEPDSWVEVESFAKHPGFLDANGNPPYTDVGVLILRLPVTGIRPAPLPAPFLLDHLLDAGLLDHGNDNPTLLTVVGYGLSAEDQFRADGFRHAGVQGFFNLRADWVYCSNHANRGYHESLQGDSGGPLIWTDPKTGSDCLVAINSGWNHLETFARLDTPEVLFWLELVLDSVDD